MTVWGLFDFLGYVLSDLGYDVWMGNARGNRYSKNHTSLNSDYVEFWDFTFHEMGKYDLPANIDYILANTGYDQLHYIGHSQVGIKFFCREDHKNNKSD